MSKWNAFLSSSCRKVTSTASRVYERLMCMKISFSWCIKKTKQKKTIQAPEWGLVTSLWCPAGPQCPPHHHPERACGWAATFPAHPLRAGARPWHDSLPVRSADLPAKPEGMFFSPGTMTFWSSFKKWFHFARQTANKIDSFLVTTHTAINLSLGKLFPERCEMRPLWSSVGTESPQEAFLSPRLHLSLKNRETILIQSTGKTRLISCSINTDFWKTSSRQLFHCLHEAGPDLPSRVFLFNCLC